MQVGPKEIGRNKAKEIKGGRIMPEWTLNVVFVVFCAFCAIYGVYLGMNKLVDKLIETLFDE